MAEPTLTEVFGTNALQDASVITLDKADLTGLTASVDNTAESLLVAIVLKAISALSQTNFDTNLDQSVLISLGLPNFLNRGENNDTYRADQISITLAKIDSEATLNPDDY